MLTLGPWPPALSAKREDVLKVTLDDYLEWVGPVREAFIWASDFLADRHIFDTRFLPYPKQRVANYMCHSLAADLSASSRVRIAGCARATSRTAA